MEQFLDYAITTGQPDKANSALAFRRGHLADFAPMRRCTLPKWIPLFDLACALGRETFPDVWNASEDFRLFLTEREVESVATALRSGAVPTRGVVCTRRIERGTGPFGPQRIERYLTVASEIDVWHNQVTATVEGRRMTFDHVEVDEIAARKWLNENAREGATDHIDTTTTDETATTIATAMEAKPGPKTRYPEFEQRYRDGERLTNRQVMDKFGIKERQVSRWRRKVRRKG